MAGDAASFVIVDPNLRNVVGHYFEYDRTVAEGAAAAGYRTVVLGAHDIEPEIARPLGAQGVFTRDIWGLQGHGSRWRVGFNKLRDN
ncbi:MAG: hypothetical protein AB7O80_17435, partial [Acetobacteraceae bacterium]